jgi:hypothetical protein
MGKKIYIKCAHCGQTQETVEDSKAIPGVPATYVPIAEEQHLYSVNHAAEVIKKESIDRGLREAGFKPHELKESIVGRLTEFDHGKDHNA